MKNEQNILSIGKQVIQDEITGLETLYCQLGNEFELLVNECEETAKKHGNVVFTGIGKSAHISKKIVATLQSTGTHSAFLYPVEAMHGDLGLLNQNDLIVTVSYSGETDELLRVIPSFRSLNLKVVAITGNKESRLAKESAFVVPMKINKEACPFNLAPTVSTTALLALGDALAITLMKRRSFQLYDYAKLHPSGAIGRSLTNRVKDIMHTYQNAPLLTESNTVRMAALMMVKTGSPIIVVVDEFAKPHSIILNEDIEEAMKAGKDNDPIQLLIKPVPLFSESDMAVDVLKLHKEQGFNYAVAVTENRFFAGIVFTSDLAKFKI